MAIIGYKICKNRKPQTCIQCNTAIPVGTAHAVYTTMSSNFQTSHLCPKCMPVDVCEKDAKARIWRMAIDAAKGETQQ